MNTQHVFHMIRASSLATCVCLGALATVSCSGAGPGPAASATTAGSAAAGPDSPGSATVASPKAQGFADAVKATQPLAWFRLNAASGSSESGPARYTSSGSVSVSSPGAPIGDAGNHFAKFDGHDGWIETTQVGGIKTQASMMAWVYLDALPSTRHRFFYVMGESQSGNDLDLQFEDDDKLKFYTAGGDHSTFAPPPGQLVQHWHQIVATLNTEAKRRAIYWDGKQVALDQEGGSPNKTSVLTLGSSKVFPGRWFEGGIEEAAIWDRELSAGDVAALYAASGPAAK
jgi:hypothetical protein